MEVGVEVWVKGKGKDEGWFSGSVTAKVKNTLIILYRF